MYLAWQTSGQKLEEHAVLSSHNQDQWFARSRGAEQRDRDRNREIETEKENIQIEGEIIQIEGEIIQIEEAEIIHRERQTRRKREAKQTDGKKDRERERLCA